MNPYEFNHNTCHWDAYRRPYQPVGKYRSYYAADDAPFIVFDTGEVIAKYTGWNKDRRKRYLDLEVTVFSTADAAAPKLYYNTGEAVPKTHLTVGGGQDLMLDEATGTVVGCGYTLANGHLKGSHRAETDKRHLEIPSYFWQRQLSVYWPGPGREPVGSRIKVVRPIKLDDAQRKHVRDLKAAAAAWRYLQPERSKEQFWAKQSYTYPSLQHVSHETLLKVENFADMSEVLRWQIEAWPVAASYETVYVDHLKIKQ